MKEKNFWISLVQDQKRKTIQIAKPRINTITLYEIAVVCITIFINSGEQNPLGCKCIDSR